MRRALSVRTAVVWAVGATFVISVMLFVRLDVSTVVQSVDELERPQRYPGPLPPVDVAVRDVDAPKIIGDKMMDVMTSTADVIIRRHDDVDHLLRLVTDHNSSLVDVRRTLAKLRAAVRSLESRLDHPVVATGESPANDRRTEAGLPSDLPAIDIGGQQATTAEPRTDERERDSRRVNIELSKGDLLTDGLRRALEFDIDDTVVHVLRDLAAKCRRHRQSQPEEEIRHVRLHKRAVHAWQQFYNNIGQYELYRRPSGSISYVDQLLKHLASLPIAKVEEMPDEGTQLKLILTLQDGTKLMFKPMRNSKDVESNPNHFVFNEMERHHAEIAAFHLDRLLDFRRVPPVAGRYINMTSELLPLASKTLAKTFYISPANNLCFFGDCKYYCDSHHAVCGNPYVIEGSCAAFLPSKDDYPRKTWPNPWAQTYSKRRRVPHWKMQEDFCDDVRNSPPFDTGRRLLDLMDISVFDFLTGNMDRHHYYTFEDFGNFTFPILTDNGRGFGRSRKDDVELLAPIYQCCLIRASTFIKLIDFLPNDTGNGRTLSSAMRESLANDVIADVLNETHLKALDRRLNIVALVLYDCLNRTLTDWRTVIVDDGF